MCRAKRPCEGLRSSAACAGSIPTSAAMVRATTLQWNGVRAIGARTLPASTQRFWPQMPRPSPSWRVTPKAKYFVRRAPKLSRRSPRVPLGGLRCIWGSTWSRSASLGHRGPPTGQAAAPPRRGEARPGQARPGEARRGRYGARGCVRCAAHWLEAPPGAPATTPQRSPSTSRDIELSRGRTVGNSNRNDSENSNSNVPAHSSLRVGIVRPFASCLRGACGSPSDPAPRSVHAVTNTGRWLNSKAPGF